MSDRISEHISLKEGIKSHTATRLNIDNIPRELDLINMKTIAEQVFEPLRKWVGGPIAINSFYRSPKLNSAIGGSTTSQHCIGCALDIDDNYGYKTNAEMYDYIKNNLDYDQIIWEFGTEDNPDWVHVSYVSEDANRRRCLQAYKENGKTKYKIIWIHLFLKKWWKTRAGKAMKLMAWRLRTVEKYLTVFLKRKRKSNGF